MAIKKKKYEAGHSKVMQPPKIVAKWNAAIRKKNHVKYAEKQITKCWEWIRKGEEE